MDNKNLNFPEREEKILEFWKKNKIFEKSLAKNSKAEKFVFYEGPPTANGMPGFHHVLARVFKDVILRYKTMRGFYVPRKAGWDTHGLPVEIEVEKELGFKTKQEIEKYGIGRFNQKAKESVWKYKDEWEKFTDRISFWLDEKNPYITYETSYIETLWWIIKEFWKKGFLYQDFKVMPWCTRCETGLSSHELSQGYKKIKELSVYIRFCLKSKDKRFKNTYILSWTTTPWTLPGNVALAVNPDFTYVKVVFDQSPTPRGESDFDQARYIIEKNLYYKFLKEFKLNGNIIESIKGKDFIGLEYEPLFNIKELKSDKSYKIYPADFVTAEEGTGVVHTAVMYGEDDYKLGSKIGLPKFHTVDEQGRFIKKLEGGLGGLHVKDSEAESRVIKYLYEKGSLFETKKYEHDYPFCWRCQTPLLYYARTSWWLKVSNVRAKLIKNNQAVNWIPNHLKDGRFGEFLKEARDWAFSRERFWGTPLPIWVCKKCSHQEVVGSLKELSSLNKNKELPCDESGEINLHRPYIDEFEVWCGKCNSKMKRVPEVVDVWFDSGAMPFAGVHYPFAEGDGSLASRGKPDFPYPADYICEAVDQTRGWFYTLLVVATLLGRKAPYKNVISTGHVLDKNGQKMSKSKGNVVDPQEMMNKYGADSIRWYFYTINSPGEPKNFDEKDLSRKLWGFIGTLWNSFVLLDTYSGNISKLESHSILDKWILIKLNLLINDITKKLDSYDITGSARAIEDFIINDLSQWYLRRSRTKFQHPESQKDKEEVSYVTSYVLLNLCKLCAPLAPFISEEIFQGLSKKFKNLKFKDLSIHLTEWPSSKKIKAHDLKLINDMLTVRNIASEALGLRAEAGIKVRQPLQELRIMNHELRKNSELLGLLKDELNVKEVTFGKKLELNTTITTELKEEGLVREIIRNIQEMRKDMGLEPKDKITVRFSGADEIGNLLDRWSSEFKKQAGIIKMIVGGKKVFKAEKEIIIDNSKLWIGII